MRLLRLVFSLVSLCTAVAFSQVEKTDVLLLNSYHHGYLFSDELVRGVRDTFADHQITLHIEYLDSKRNDLSKYRALRTELLKEKQRQTDYQLVICSDNNAFDLIQNYRDEIYGPDTPVVFCGVNYLKRAQLQQVDNCTGINESADIRQNCDLIRKLHPTRDKLLIITDDTTTGRAFSEEVQLLKPELEKQFTKINITTDYSIKEILAELQSLDDSWAVLYSFYFRDRDAGYIEYDDSARIIAESSPVPVHCLWRFSMNSGMIGGKLVDGYLQGTSAAKLALEVLNGTSAEKIPVNMETPLNDVFDYRALQRFGIDLKALPAGSTIEHEPPTLYAEYKQYFWGVVIGFPALSLIIIVLLHNLRRSRQAEEALKESKVRLLNARNYITSVTDSMPSWLIAIDGEMQITQLNRTTLEESGQSVEKIKGEIITKAFPVLLPQIGLIKRALQTRTPVQATKVSLHLIDSMEFATLTIYPLTTEEKNGAVIRIDDVTQQVQLEQKLGQQAKMQAIGKLAGGVAHDFNNLLCGIFQLVENMDEHVDEQGKNSLQMIMDSAKRAADLTDQLLTFSRKKELTGKPIDLHHTINDCVALLQRTLNKNIILQTDLNADAFTVWGDEAQLHSALLNLGINAGHAMPDGGTLVYTSQIIHLDESACQNSPFDITPGDFLELNVRDTGIGIPEHQLSRIFEPFFTTRAEEKGTGLGLAAVYGTVEKHQGQITVSSHPNQGSTFRICLPLFKNHVVNDIKKRLPPIGSGQILLVDDSELVRDATGILLERLGYEVLLASNGTEALELYKNRTGKIKMVLLDMIMPGLSGSETLTRLKEMDPEVCVLVASGHAERDATKHISGHAGFIQKPYTKQELSRKILDCTNS